MIMIIIMIIMMIMIMIMIIIIHATSGTCVKTGVQWCRPATAGSSYSCFHSTCLYVKSIYEI